jgi:hypothetical protein
MANSRSFRLRDLAVVALRMTSSKEKPGARPGFLVRLVRVSKCGKAAVRRPRRSLGGGHFFGFAFLAHHFELALGFFVSSLHFLLDADSRFFKLG